MRLHDCVLTNKNKNCSFRTLKLPKAMIDAYSDIIDFLKFYCSLLYKLINLR